MPRIWKELCEIGYVLGLAVSPVMENHLAACFVSLNRFLQTLKIIGIFHLYFQCTLLKYAFITYEAMCESAPTGT